MIWELSVGRICREPLHSFTLRFHFACNLGISPFDSRHSILVSQKWSTYKRQPLDTWPLAFWRPRGLSMYCEPAAFADIRRRSHLRFACFNTPAVLHLTAPDVPERALKPAWQTRLQVAPRFRRFLPVGQLPAATPAPKLDTATAVEHLRTAQWACMKGKKSN